MRTTTIGVVALLGLLAAAFSDPFSPVTINGQVGQPAIVEGVVSEVHTATRSGVTFINLGGHYPFNRFQAVIWADDATKFPDVGALSGRTVRITGVLRLYQGRQEIILRDPSQLKAR